MARQRKRVTVTDVTNEKEDKVAEVSTNGLRAHVPENKPAELTDEDWEGYTRFPGSVLLPNKSVSALCPICKIPAQVTSTRDSVRYHRCGGHTFVNSGKEVRGCNTNFKTIRLRRSFGLSTAWVDPEGTSVATPEKEGDIV